MPAPWDILLCTIFETNKDTEAQDQFHNKGDRVGDTDPDGIRYSRNVFVRAGYQAILFLQQIFGFGIQNDVRPYNSWL